jgi:hypothetical protein
MKRTPCEHWIAVADAKALGREVMHDDVARANRHESSCSACAEEGDVWRKLATTSAGPPAPSGVRLGHSRPPPRRVSNRPEDDTPFDSIMRAVPVRARSAPRVGLRGRHAGAALSIAAGLVVAVVLVRSLDARHRSLATDAYAERSQPPSDPPAASPGADRHGPASPPEVEGPASAGAVLQSPTSPVASADATAAGGAHPLDSQDGLVVRSPAQGLARGRALSARGDFRGAAAVYRAVCVRGPQTPEGRAALVSLGDLLVSDLGDPTGALAAFDEYLSRRGGDLTRRAAYGRIRALRALARGPEEHAAAQDFLARYRSGADADAVRRALRSTR